jgi:hypothetical protein
MTTSRIVGLKIPGIGKCVNVEGGKRMRRWLRWFNAPLGNSVNECRDETIMQEQKGSRIRRRL